MSRGIDWRFFGEVFVTLIVIMDPPGSVPIFLGLTAGRPAAARQRLAWQAVLVSAGVISVFALFGQQILSYLNISIAALQGAGGLLLILVALELLTGSSKNPTATREVNVALVPLGTPLLAGPGRSWPRSSSFARRTACPTGWLSPLGWWQCTRCSISRCATRSAFCG